MRVKSHFTLLVYLFRHAISERERLERLKRLSGLWLHWWLRLDESSLEKALDDTYFFLPYLRTLLFPETSLLPKGSSTVQLEEAKRIAPMPINELAKKLHPDGVLRLTFSPENLKVFHPLRLEFERRDERGEIVEQFFASMRILWIDTILFPQNLGFLALKVQIDEDEITTHRLSDWLYYLRLVLTLAVGWQLADRKLESDEKTYDLQEP
ncbi:MAG: hypothetical protein NZ805_03000 [Armatimonadetes bacterium]|nr:hypothetical protein [Armatimonadota bacterium]MDW8027853.1 hypothetical protein [Armatimonadota bacterium]